MSDNSNFCQHLFSKLFSKHLRLTASVEIVHYNTVGGTGVFLKGHGQLAAHDSHIDGTVSAVERHKRCKRFLSIRVKPPDFDDVV